MAFIGALSGALGNLPTPPTPPIPGGGGGFIGGWTPPTPPIPPITGGSGGFIGGWTPPTPPIPPTSGTGFLGGVFNPPNPPNIPTPGGGGGFLGGVFNPPNPPTTSGSGFLGGVFNPPNPPNINTGNVPYHTHNIQTTGPNSVKRGRGIGTAIGLPAGTAPNPIHTIPGQPYTSIPRPNTTLGPAGLPVSQLQQAPASKGFSNASGCSLWMCDQY